ncbi:hypothetical protein FRC08_009656 [Ceratobasidium sp. 394]|nr:hypothetical protein FRC08_009656 [Ceratobasidium sp. 394]
MPQQAQLKQPDESGPNQHPPSLVVSSVAPIAHHDALRSQLIARDGHGLVPRLQQAASTHSSYCSLECMSREDLPVIASPAPHAVNSRLRARLEGPSPTGWSRKVREPRSRSMSRARPRPSNVPRAPPVLEFSGSDRAPSPESEVAWSLPAAGATRLVGSRWMGKDYEGIKCWAYGVRGFPDDDLSDLSEDDDSDVFHSQPATQPIFPISHAPSLTLSASRPAPPTLSTQLSITPKHHLSLLTCDDTASLATPVTDICLAQGYVESVQSPNTPPNQAAHHLRRFVTGTVLSSQPASTPKDRSLSTPAPSVTPKSFSVEPVWIAQTTRAPLRVAAQRGRDWGGLYDECEKEQLASDRIGSFVPPSSWSRGRTRERSHTEYVFQR